MEWFMKLTCLPVSDVLYNYGVAGKRNNTL